MDGEIEELQARNTRLANFVKSIKSSLFSENVCPCDIVQLKSFNEANRGIIANSYNKYIFGIVLSE